MCTVKLAQGVENLYIAALLRAGNDEAEVRIAGSHANVVYMALNGRDLMDGSAGGQISRDETPAESAKTEKSDAKTMNVMDILNFAKTVPLRDVKPIIGDQIAMNTAISEEGLRKVYGAAVGRMLLNTQGSSLRTRARAKAAAGSDARMSGSPMPVVINSGSGNQGITVSLPVIEFAREMAVSEEALYRALVLANLVALYQKSMIGKLSAFCGAVTAACGAGAGIEFLYGGGYDEIVKTIKNTLANVSGIICDGAKPSCAAKIASAVDAAIMAHDLTKNGYVFGAGEGLIEEDIERTMKNIGRVGRVGMRDTDEEILNLMIGVTRC
jgi:L-cysteine desulfidase